MIKRKCPHCDKVIEAYTKKQLDHMIKQHIISKHKSKVKFK